MALLGSLLSFVLIVFITGNLQTIFFIFSGHGSNTAVISGGTNNVSDLVINFSDNFRGQLSYRYAILSFLLSGLSIFFFVKLRGSMLRFEKNLFVSSTVLILLILSIWTIFRFSIFISQEIFLSMYVPEVAAYEPFMGITLIFSLFFLEMLILWKASSCNVEATSINQRLTNVGTTQRRQKSLKSIILIFIVVILLTSSIGYWRQDVPSVSGEVTNPDLAFGQFAVPTEYASMSEYLNSHLAASGGRYILLPYAGMSSEAISSSIPEISSVTLPNSLWNEILGADNSSSSFRTFSQDLALLGIEYIVINKWPFIPGDSQASFSGQARIIEAGFPWDLSYLPAGSWQNWSQVFKSDSYLTTVINNQNWIVLQNQFFEGLFHAYSLPCNFLMSDISSMSSNGSILYFTNESQVPLNFSIPENNAFQFNWSKDYGPNGTISYTGGPLPKGMTSSNIWEQIAMKNSSYYELNYSASGLNMSGSVIYLRFYSGPNMTGNVISTIGGPTLTGNVSNLPINFQFKTPKDFNSSAIFLTYFANPSSRFYTYSFDIVSFRYENESYPVSDPLIVSYHYINPTELSVHMNLPSNSTILVLYSATFNPEWALTAGSFTRYSTSMALFSFVFFNSFLVNKNTSNFTIVFTAQKAYMTQLVANWFILGSTCLILGEVYFLDLRRKGNERK